MIKLFSGFRVPTTIRTDERIFEVLTYDNEFVLCNLKYAYELIRASECKGLKHYWNNKFTPIGKNTVIEMFELK